MPIGSTCRACGTTLPADLGWCSTCFTPVTLFAAREPLHGSGGFVGQSIDEVRTSRWRAGPTTFGPVGRILSTIVLCAFFPWWGLGGVSNPLFLWSLMGWVTAASLVLRSVWRRERVIEGPPSLLDRFRQRHPMWGREVRVGRGTRIVVVAVVGGAAIAAWLGLEKDVRYIWAVVAIVFGLGILLARWNDL